MKLFEGKTVKLTCCGMNRYPPCFQTGCQPYHREKKALSLSLQSYSFPVCNPKDAFYKFSLENNLVFAINIKFHMHIFYYKYKKYS